MSIKIHRNTGLMGSGGLMKIKVNDQIEKLKLDEPNVIHIEEKTATIELKELGTQRQIVNVKDGAVLEIKTRKWYTPMIFSIIIFLVIANSILGVSNFWKFLLVIIPVFFVTNYFFPPYKLSIIED
ncbi:hypothetical protein [Marinilactibacillus sp. Marseille-P9653]|uniref:hypothetical protein n=1 Tax=Marinilactibacillus sp. Marseille-P9653 TaxID=2866583 RepID=UPI001CE42571|nr:hypothetical protein [Marinilactibacillus sp. Marseille-P9653]